MNQYYKIDDVVKVLDVTAPSTIKGRMILGYDRLMTVKDIMSDLIPVCVPKNEKDVDLRRLKQRNAQITDGDIVLKETLPERCDQAPNVLQWQYGQDASALVSALLAVGILVRHFRDQIMLDVEKVASFSMFTQEQARRMWQTITPVKDFQGRLYIPIGTFLLYQFSSICFSFY